MRRTNRKGVALLLVAGLVMVAVPVTMLLLNLSKTQKEQATHYNSVLNVEQISLSGINMGYSRLKSGYERGYNYFPAEISGKDRYDLNMTPTGTGFFKQDIYLLLSKAKEGRNSSIILADAEQFQEEDKNKPVLVITHDYWATPEHRELSLAKDVYALKNFRGADQLRALDVKKYELSCDETEFKNTMNSLTNFLPSEIKEVWDTVVENATNDKIYGDDTPQPDKVGAGYNTYASKKTGGSTSTKKNNNSSSGSKTTSSGSSSSKSTGSTSTSSTGATHYDDRGFPKNNTSSTSSSSSSTKSTGNTTADIERAKGEKRLKEMGLK
ncbi:MAG: hypothetical protein IKO19_10870 [Candidatus Riflebacteria bacterium]|nr:hypothetical protein [Candidatus Riflebacteria bacterium]MBR4571148.1 hypothetical protein [Candidatus Riflebacteria bacterium]